MRLASCGTFAYHAIDVASIILLAMPEAPDLKVVSEILTRRVVGRQITHAILQKATVMRLMASQDFTADIAGRTMQAVFPKGKFLFITLSGDAHLVINPMLTGGFQICPSSDKPYRRTRLTLNLEDDLDLRYLDDREMGRVYYVRGEQFSEIPQLDEQGPDVLADDLSFEDFKARLRPYYGEIKGILCRGVVLAGIGNAYSDEILFDCGISPFRKRRSLSDDELARLHHSARKVVLEASETLRDRMGDESHHKIRDFLKVHNKGGQPCPECGGHITQLTANQRITSYCRRCQPGMLVKN